MVAKLTEMGLTLSEKQKQQMLDMDHLFAILQKKLPKYGFILRYPKDKEPITGIIYEPWHFRYVGTELSLELEELGLCMEEYMDMLTASQQAG